MNGRHTYGGTSSQRAARPFALAAAATMMLLAACGSGPSEPSPASLALHIDTLMRQALAAQAAATTTQSKTAYGARYSILGDARLAAAYGARQTDIAVNGGLGSGQWHALSFQEIVPPGNGADSFYRVVVYRDDFATAIDLNLVNAGTTVFRQFLYYGGDTLYALSAPSFSAAAKSLPPNGTQCLPDNVLLDSLNVSFGSFMCQSGDFVVSAAVAVPPTQGQAPMPGAGLGIFKQTVKGIRFVPK
jgi:hypothetical protein